MEYWFQKPFEIMAYLLASINESKYETWHYLEKFILKEWKDLSVELVLYYFCNVEFHWVKKWILYNADRKVRLKFKNSSII